jgi:hypothetical protein
LPVDVTAALPPPPIAGWGVATATAFPDKTIYYLKKYFRNYL